MRASAMLTRLCAAAVLLAVVLPACEQRARQAPATTREPPPAAAEDGGPASAETTGAELLREEAADAGAVNAMDVESAPSWVPREAPLTIVDAHDRARNLGLVGPEATRTESVVVGDAGAPQVIVTTVRCP
jgi:hypothetical protein